VGGGGWEGVCAGGAVNARAGSQSSQGYRVCTAPIRGTFSFPTECSGLKMGGSGRAAAVLAMAGESRRPPAMRSPVSSAPAGF